MALSSPDNTSPALISLAAFGAGSASCAHVADAIMGAACADNVDNDGDARKRAPYHLLRLHDGLCAAFHDIDVLAEHPALAKGIGEAVEPATFGAAVTAALAADGGTGARAGELPTLSEAGLTGFSADNWFGIMAPAGTPGPVIAKLNAEIVKALDSAEVKDIVARQGGELMGSTPQQMAAQIAADRGKWGKVVRESGARIE